MSDNVNTPRPAVPLGSIVGADQCLSLLTVFLHPVDHSEQLGAIRRDIAQRRALEQTRSLEIETVASNAGQATSAYASDALANLHADLVYTSAYDDAAHSMAAVGMLAPFIESLFCRYFLTLSTMPIADGLLPPAHVRRKLKTAMWDCHYVWNDRKRTDPVTGIIELSAITGLNSHLPGDIQITLSALFGYRNEMFHHGLEWPRSIRDGFARTVISAVPVEWFCPSRIDGQTWLFYMSETFIAACLHLAESVIVAMNTHLESKCSGPDCAAWWTERLQNPDV